jgi:hypothetical protein
MGQIFVRENRGIGGNVNQVDRNGWNFSQNGAAQ